jgi:hypothetical protein
LLSVDRGELRRQVDVLKSSPARDIQAENIVEVVTLGDPLVHHFCECWPTFGV